MNHLHYFRRGLAGALVLTAGVIWGCQSMSQNTDDATGNIAIVAGTYSQQGSEGIYRFFLDRHTGEMSAPTLLLATDNPSYLAVSDARLFVANESDPGQLSTVVLDPESGMGSEISRKATGGAAPCYLSLHPSAQFVATANYNGGNISVFRLDDAGVPIADATVRDHTGRVGPHPDRQDAPHAHWVQWDPQGQYLYSVDLGLDEIKQFDFDGDTGRLSDARTALRLQPGDGPRHMFFHPELSVTYILNELSNTVVTAALDENGKLTERQRLGTLPPAFTGHSQAAHLYVTRDGRHLYVSNRGHNSITAFAIDEKGHLRWLDNTSTGGDWPRHFLVLEDAGILLVANQQANTVGQLTIDADGRLALTDQTLTVPQVTFLGQL